jgi:hypothetical protein
MPPRIEPDNVTQRMQLVTTSAWLAAVDAWRAKQRPIPNRSAAIRELVERALAAVKD